VTRFYIRARESLSEETATKAWTREVRRHPAAHEVNLRQELASEEFGHLMPAPHRFCEYDDTPKLTVVLVLAQDRVCWDYNTPKSMMVLPKVGTWTGMLLFSLGFYYGLGRLVMWATSL
jgi:hypothetical protein